MADRTTHGRMTVCRRARSVALDPAHGAPGLWARASPPALGDRSPAHRTDPQGTAGAASRRARERPRTCPSSAEPMPNSHGLWRKQHSNISKAAQAKLLNVTNCFWGIILSNPFKTRFLHKDQLDMFS